MVNFENVLSFGKDKKKCKVGILGSNGSFGYTFLAQIVLMKKSLSLRVVCDLNAEKT